MLDLIIVGSLIGLIVVRKFSNDKIYSKNEQKEVGKKNVKKH